MKRSAWVVVGFLVGCGGNTAKVGVLPGEIIGRVEVSAGVEATGCQVVLEGTPLGGRCDDSGQFDIRKVPPGRWDLRIITSSVAASLPAKRVAAGSNPGLVSDIGAVQLAKPGAIGGHLLGAAANLSLAAIAVPEVGAVTAPNANGGYLLEGVSPGVHEVVLITDNGTAVRRDVNVQSGKVTIGADLDLATIASNTVAVTGRALRAGAADDGHGGVTVELVDSLDGKVVTTATTTDDGSFSVDAKYGTYVVRARDGGSPVTAIIPSVVVRGTLDIQLASPLAVHDPDADLDGDGTPNSTDKDIDGDGIPNEMDAFPYDPAEVQDTDKDGLGDRSDLRSQGGPGVDTKNPTPDSDADGKLDFEDNCPMAANADQKDVDGDTIGDLCDNCPINFNTEQADSLKNGTGDACRFCTTNGDCGGGKICGQFGQCVDCISSTQCGDKVCDQGKCVACTSTTQCGGGKKCSPLIGRCVECVGDSDCAAGMACLQGVCFAQCTMDAQCPGAFCVSGACKQCRANTDCPGAEYCDQGSCRPQCAADADCTGGRLCDGATKTCVLPCAALCPVGQACDPAMVCRAVCGSNAQCGAHEKCTTAGFCGPECTVDADCTAADPFSRCQVNQCVTNHTCAVDADCPNQADVCNGAACQTRPSLACAGPCDCRQGEVCSLAGTCVVDGVQPNRFVATAGTGDGSAVSKVSPSLATVAAAAASGDVIALKSGDTVNVSAAVTIAAAGVKLVGGYEACASNRWVRDRAAATTIVNTNGMSKSVIIVAGTAAAPLADVQLQNLVLQGADAGTAAVYRVVDVLNAPRFSASNVIIRFAPSVATGNRGITGITCTGCTGASFTDVSTPGVTDGVYNTTRYLLETIAGSATFLRTHSGPVGTSTYYVIRAASAIGDLTITDTTFDGFTNVNGSGTSGTMLIDTPAPAAKVAINGFQLVWSNENGVCTNNYVVHLKGAQSFAIAPSPTMMNLIDGSAVNELSISCGTRSAIRVEDSAGTISDTTIVFPQLNASGSNYLYGVEIVGPNGGVTIDGLTTSGGQGGYFEMVHASDVLSAPVVIQNSSLSGGTTTARGRGFYFNKLGGPFRVTDTVVNPPANVSGGSAIIQGFAADTTIGRIERCKFILRPGYIQSGGRTDRTTLELYDSYFYASTGTTLTLGFENGGGSTLTAIGNTFDAGGSPVAGNSQGFQCDNAATANFQSNLVNGGKSAASHWMAYSVSGNGCFTSASSTFRNNYFYYTYAGPVIAGDGTVQIAANMNSSMNLIDSVGSSGCFDPMAAPGDHHILSGSRCVDAGVTGRRSDMSAIDEDVDGNPRTLGAAPDIGCSEKQ